MVEVSLFGRENNIASELENRLAVVVSSCDKYADLKKLFFTLFWKFQPDFSFLSISAE